MFQLLLPLNWAWRHLRPLNRFAERCVSGRTIATPFGNMTVENQFIVIFRFFLRSRIATSEECVVLVPALFNCRAPKKVSLLVSCSRAFLLLFSDIGVPVLSWADVTVATRTFHKRFVSESNSKCIKNIYKLYILCRGFVLSTKVFVSFCTKNIELWRIRININY